ncbi:hypothetical protein [Dulcicalothrix desertica]|nr:hypothetical protein [Dulcicalothrix desertica]
MVRDATGLSLRLKIVVSVTHPTKTNAQYHLEENGYVSNDEWRVD